MTIRVASCLVVFLVVGLESIPSHACPGMFMPPFKLDLGRTWSESGTQTATGSVLLVGLSRATLDPRPVAFDIGLGYVRWSAGDDTSTTVARSTTSSPSISDAQGGYLELAARVQESKHMRSWLAVRGELLDAAGTAFGLAARVATEVWTGASVRDGGVFAIGSLAIGAYAEVGFRDGRDDVKTFSVGLSLRSPFAAIGGGPRRSPTEAARTSKVAAK
jgi:hypothetical protein